MLKEHRHLKIQRQMRIEMALNELNVCYHGEAEDASLGDRWVTSGVVCGQVWTNYPRGLCFPDACSFLAFVIA